MHFLRFLLFGSLMFVHTSAQTYEAGRLRLIPFPKHATIAEGTCTLARPLEFRVAGSDAAVFGNVLNSELRRAGLPEARVLRMDGSSPRFQLATAGQAPPFPSLPATDMQERYALEVQDTGVAGCAAEPAGLLFALQTLCQLIRANREGTAIPCMSIRDWPSLRWRCFQDDMTRGPSSTLATLKFEAALGSYLKLNLMTFYMEYQYAFGKHPKIGPPDGSLTPEDLASIVAYAKSLHVDVLGNQQSFGHFAQILSHPEFANLRETADVLTPVREETYQLLDELYSEVCPLVPFPWFNVCCDETAGLGTGPSRQLASEIGVGGVYVKHIRRVHDLLRDRYQKRMMMWGDIILQHPDHLQEIPKDTLMLTWGYDARSNFEDQILPFARSGYGFFVCPGVNNWSRILPDFGVAVTNIQNFVRDGAKHGAMGMINTDWEDDGEALNGMKWHADAWAAECAWNASTTSYDAFQRRVGAVLFGERGEHFGQAISLLTQVHRLPGMKGLFNARFWELDLPPRGNAAVTTQNASNLLACVKPALSHLDACGAEAVDNKHVLKTLRFASRRLELIGNRMIHGLEASQLYERAVDGQSPLAQIERAEELLREDRGAHEILGREFAELWLSESKPYALDWTLRRYTNALTDYDAVLGRLKAARILAQAGRPIPAADEIGLAVPRPIVRNLNPREVSSAALAPDQPWAASGATHRIGLDVGSGDLDRQDLPVEVEILVPEGVPVSNVRAFRLGDPAGPQEVPAQLDPISSSRHHRLTIVVPGPLPNGSHATFQVYLGAGMTVPTRPGSAHTIPGSAGTVWIENDRVRLLLGPEGAHVYRWEVKALGGRDLTMPGESGWAGFTDLVSHRGVPYQLDCTARGPALVEYQCREPGGQTKIIRLFEGASWIEVLLGEPTPNYWDFDAPRNFAAEGPTPGTWRFSNGRSGSVGKESQGVPAQVKMPGTTWGIKYNAERVALGLITPETPTLHVVAPGAGAGGVGIEGGPAASHFITFGGMLDASAEDVMNRLQNTLNFKRAVDVRVYGWQTH